MEKEQWKTKPTLIHKWPAGVGYIMGLDENGHNNLNIVRKRLERQEEVKLEDGEFTLTGVYMDASSYGDFRRHLDQLKATFWPPHGNAEYKGQTKEVCFHSREIRKREHPFNIPEYDNFMAELSEMVALANGTVVAASINKELLCQKYSRPYDPYDLSIAFILERFCSQLNAVDQKGVIILESRGAGHDRSLLEHIVAVLDRGTQYLEAAHFSRIVGVYFNTKWNMTVNPPKTHAILELADILSYPIHKHVRRREFKRDRAFAVVEKKFHNYPIYWGWGLKLFPVN